MNEEAFIRFDCIARQFANPGIASSSSGSSVAAQVGGQRDLENTRDLKTKAENKACG
jgi:hypothetical protein